MIFRNIVFILCFSGIKIVDNATAQEGSSPLIQHLVTSETTHQDYRLFVIVPEGYRLNTNEEYDVVYVLDINTEDSAQLASFQRSISQMSNIPKVIYVGIGFSPDEEHRGLRTAHFTPSPNKVIDEEIISLYRDTPELRNSSNWASGKAKKSADVLALDIKYFVEENYRTSETETILGTSLAGLFLTTVLLDQPEMFTNYIIASPSVWWNNFEIFENTDAVARTDIEAKIYLAVGGSENSEMLESFEKLNNSFGQNNSIGLKFHSEVIENQDHLSVVPISYMRGLQYVYSQ